MLISAPNAAHFLREYKEMLSRFAGRPVKAFEEYIAIRNEFVASAGRDRPPTTDSDLLRALAGSVHGDFVVARHHDQYTEMVGPNERAYRVKGLTVEPRAMVQPWVTIRTTVMPFRGDWIWDGLVNSLGVRIGPGMKRSILERIRLGVVAAPAVSSEPASTPVVAPSKPVFTPKQGQYLAYIHYYIKRNRRAPAEADLQRHFQVTAPTVHQMILTLEKRRLIKRVPGQSRSIELLISEDQLPTLRGIVFGTTGRGV